MVAGARRACMDDLDAAILREMFRERVLLWGGHDPRLGTRDVADRLGVDRTTVWSRMRDWKEGGFLVRQEVLPNPSLFGAGIAAGEVRVDDPRRKAQAIEDLQLVDGVLSGLDLVGPYILVVYALESERALDRCTRLVAKLPSVDEVETCVPFEPPRSEIQPTARDWRILQALRRSPERPLTEIADDVGISRRTLTRRYGELLDANALWSFPVFDFSRYGGAVMARFTVLLTAPEALPPFVNSCQTGLPQMVWRMTSHDVAPTAQGEHAWADVFCHLHAAGEVESVQKWLLDLPSVQAADVFFPKEWFVTSAWFDERIGKHVADGSVTRP